MFGIQFNCENSSIIIIRFKTLKFSNNYMKFNWLMEVMWITIGISSHLSQTGNLSIRI